MIKFLVSSEYMAEMLMTIDWEKQSVERISVFEYEITLLTQNTALTISCHVFTGSVKSLAIKKGNWGNVKELLSKIPDQPVLMEIYDNIINVTFQY